MFSCIFFSICRRIHDTNLRSLFYLGKLYCDLESALEKKIDLITLSSLEQTTRLSSDELFRSNIEREKVKLYDVA